MPGTPKKRAKKTAKAITDIKVPALPVVSEKATATALARATYRLERDEREWERAAALPKGPTELRALEVQDERVREAIMGMAWAGLAPDRIAGALGMPLEALMALYGAEVQHGTDVMLGQVTGRLVMNALTGDTKAAELILKERAGWKDKTTLEVDDKSQVMSEDERKKMVTRILDHVDELRRQALAPPTIDGEFKEVD
jgi:hypothetical protein